MDRMYKAQVRIYDATRKYYLFGRDRLIDRMTVAPGQHVLEIGCGTGRNLILLARKHPDAHFYGLDAARVMIDTAAARITRGRLQGHIALRQGLAEGLSAASFGVPAFDRIFFSYCLSMIPTWRPAIEAAIGQLSPHGELWVVDFWDQAGWPHALGAALTLWLRQFHVEHRPELLAYLQSLAADGRGPLTLDSVGRRYAYLARWTSAP
jgi:S-adenosylmethionine-diacylgycerolhomoserine-N-methlytransferase